MEQFDAYFRRADLDQDGRISGAEAVAFFQGSNLPKQVLAQVWMHADQNGTGYLGRPEFYNALKLVTVAQSKRELTPDIVKAALYGPASSKIPAPQINLAAVPAPQPNSMAPSPTPTAQMGQNLGFRGQVPPSATMNQQYYQLQGNQAMRQPIPAAASSIGLRPLGGGPAPAAGQDFPGGGSVAGPGVSNPSGWLGGRTLGTPATVSQVPNRGASPLSPSVAPKPQSDPLSVSSIISNNPKASIGTGNGFSSNPLFGGDVFATQSSSKQASSTTTYSSNSAPSSLVPAPSGPQPPLGKTDPLDSLQSAFSRPTAGGQVQTSPSVLRPNQQVSSQVASSVVPTGNSAEVSNPSLQQAQPPWPKMSRAGVQKYMKVFMEVDTDRDGKITGEQARNLFLSWRLPREVLKQVWDLSDQDNDSMLSLREFCIALYLMERYREGLTLPPTLPSSVLLDAALLAVAGPPNPSYGNAAWVGTGIGLRPPQQGMLGPQQMTPVASRPLIHGTFPGSAGQMQFNQQKAGTPTVDSSPADQFSKGEQNSINSKADEAAETDKKVENNERAILDSREKIEFYRAKMQDLVLYKSRCDNRLNEITERALGDKREAESLAKKYEEKYKQVAEIASKLTIEAASFRDIQERKMELNQAIFKMEQGGSADGILQVRADRIQSDLEELLKALTEHSKKHGVHVKSATVIELPQGWQPGVPEVSAVWDEDWDKFEDEGFLFDVVVPANAKSTSPPENSSPIDNMSPDSLSYANGKSKKPFSDVERAFDSNDESTKSSGDSPARQSSLESPSRDNSDNHFRKSFDADSETQRSFDEPTWGTFDNNDDADSVWGFSNSKDLDHQKHGESYFFGSSEFGGSPRTNDSPQADKTIQKKSAFGFDDSIPGSPVSRASNSPRYSVGAGNHFFDSMSRYDSFNTQDRSFARFDSVNSSAGFDHSRGFSFDDSDPFGSSGPFRVTSSSESQTSRKDSEKWGAF